MNAQANIHPTSYKIETKCTGCGNVMQLVSPLENTPSLFVETCHKCHPAYTGKSKTIQAKAIDKFNQKYAGFYTSKK